MYLRKPHAILDDDRQTMIKDNLEDLLGTIRIGGTDLLEYMRKEYKIEGKCVTAISEEDATAINASHPCVYLKLELSYTISFLLLKIKMHFIFF